jgi:hypothetical protein
VVFDCDGSVLVSDDVMLAERYDREAFALVVALHNGQTEAAAQMLSDLCDDEDGGATLQHIVAVCVVLALTLNEAWVEQCEADGVSFEEFVETAGLWLAQGGEA